MDHSTPTDRTAAIAAQLPEPAPKLAVKPEPSPDPVLEAFRTELRSYVDQPLTAKSLRQIMEIAEGARNLLQVRNPRLRGKRRRGMGPISMQQSSFGSSYSVGSNPGYDCDYDGSSDEDEEEDGDVPGGGVGVQYTEGRMNLDRETYGARILREIIGATTSILRVSREDPAQIVQAIAAAKKLGMDDLVESLTARLVPDDGPTPSHAPEPADAQAGAQGVEDPTKSVWASKLPESDEYLVGPATLEVVKALAEPEHEIVNTETGRVFSKAVVPAQPQEQLTGAPAQ